jgi:multicomponent Na+:H+ antiporter subunit D
VSTAHATVNQLPALQVVVPLASAPVCALLRRANIAWGLSLIASWLTFGVAALLLTQVSHTGVISYAVGGWPPPWGIELRIDLLNALVLVLVSGVSAVVITAAPQSIAREVPEDKTSLYYTAYLLCLAALLGITITGDAFNVFVFLEISSISAYALIAMGRDARALTASFRYLVMGTVGATFILISIGLMYMATGTLNMADLAQRVPSLAKLSLIHTAFAFFVVGVSLKVALFPLHYWLPNAYAYAPSIATAFLAATATKVSLYVMVRFLFNVFGFDLTFNLFKLQHLLLPLSLIAALTASIVAVFQEDVKRMLAYSSLAQIGYITLGIGLGSATGLTAGIMHLFNHALMKGALFLALAGVVYRTGSVSLTAMAGVGRKMPWTVGAFAAAGLSLIGVPLTAGFISKWYLVLAVLEKGWWAVAGLLVISSLIAVVYIWRVVEAAWFRVPDAAVDVSEAPLSILIPTWVLVAANYYFGVETTITAGIASRAANMLLGGGP